VLQGLTRREFEVAGLVTGGLANKEIAARLGVKVSTVKEHVHRILVKTGLPSRSAIARAYVGADAAADARPSAETRGGGDGAGTAHEGGA
jgi:DNA-binding NarL/FixJ family response regulator